MCVLSRHDCRLKNKFRVGDFVFARAPCTRVALKTLRNQDGLPVWCAKAPYVDLHDKLRCRYLQSTL